jgi:hypothetical protein
MTKRPTQAEIRRQIEGLDLVQGAEAQKRADALLKRMLNSPPDPHTPKAESKKRAKK